VELAIVPPAKGPNAPLVPKTFATDTTDAAGRFTLDGVPPGLANLQQPGGGVELLITGTSGDQAVHYTLIADPPSNSARSLTWEGVEEPVAPLQLQMGSGEVTDPETTTTTAMTTAGTTALTTAAGEPVELADPAAVDAGDGADEASEEPTPIAARGASSCRDGYGALMVPLDKYTRRKPPIQRLTTRAHSKQTYEFETTERTKLEVAWVGDGGNYAGGFVYSKISDTSLGMKWTQGNGKSQILRPEWQFRKYRKQCYNGRPHQTYWLDVWYWRAHKATGGSERQDSTPPWSCDGDTTVRMQVETWVARSSTVTWDGFFSIGTVKLADQQTNSSRHKLTVTPNAGESAPRICGDNDFPLYADRIKERA
jgi:hypothetical protein